MRNIALRIIAGVLLSLTVSDVAPARTHAVDVSGVVFDYPMTIINGAELKIVKERIKEKREPQWTAYKALLADAKRALDFISAPPAHTKIMGGYEKNSNLREMRALLGRESQAAYATALAWLYSGEQIYANKAVEILDAWTAANTSFSGGDRGLQLGSWFNCMLYTADILRGYDGWPVARRAAFERWWRNEVLVHVKDVMKHRANNWKDAGLLGMLTAAAVFQDRQLLGEGLAELDSYFRPRSDVAALAFFASVAGYENRKLLERGRPDGRENKGRSNKASAWKLACDERGAYLPREVTRNDGASGVMYTAYALTSLVQAMEIARYANCDWWHRKTKDGATLEGVIACYFRWNELDEPFPWHKNPRRSLVRKNPYEIANNHFPNRIDGLKTWLAQNRPVDGHQGDPYVTLNRGDVPPR